MYFLAFCIPFFAQHGVDFISLIVPTSANRIAMITREARGFIYVVSSLGVAGERAEITADVSSLVATIRENTSVPCAVGFGISIPQQAHDMGDYPLAGTVRHGSAGAYWCVREEHEGCFVGECLARTKE